MICTNCVKMIKCSRNSACMITEPQQGDLGSIHKTYISNWWVRKVSHQNYGSSGTVPSWWLASL